MDRPSLKVYDKFVQELAPDYHVRADDLQKTIKKKRENRTRRVFDDLFLLYVRGRLGKIDVNNVGAVIMELNMINPVWIRISRRYDLDSEWLKEYVNEFYGKTIL